MTNTEANIMRLMKAVDKVYTIPTYFEDRVLKELLKELNMIEKEESEED